MFHVFFAGNYLSRVQIASDFFFGSNGGAKLAFEIKTEGCLNKRGYLYPRGGGLLPEKSGWSLRPASQNSYPIYDQNLRYSLPYS